MPITFRARSDDRDDDGRHSPEYRTYLESIAWEQRRAAALHRAGHRCARCGATGPLEVHHLTYDRLGEELDSDLAVLCPPCHVKADRRRRAQAADTRDERRFDAWAAKVYGDDWGMYEDEGMVRSRYEGWKARKGID